MRNFFWGLVMTFFSCTTSSSLPPLQTVPSVDLNKFMGDWYVQASIPTFVEQGAHNAVEHYELNKNGQIDITFTFRKNSFDGPQKKLRMTGYSVDGTQNAQWKVSPFWPVKFPYYTIELAQDYSYVVVATPNRGYLWIMSRSWKMDDAQLKTIIERMIKLGFKEQEIKRVPQKWEG